MRVIVVCFMRTLPVIGLTFCVSWVLVTLLRGVFALRTMYQAWLESLIVALSRNFVVLFLVALVICVTMIVISVILPLEVGALVSLRPSIATVITLVTLLCCVVNLLIKPLAKLIKHVASDANLDPAFVLLV
jgi:hypothetical protein